MDEKKARAHRFCFTIFENEQVCRHREWGKEVFATGKARYLIWQLERAPETRKLHIQGYIECHHAVAFGSYGDGRASGLKAILRSGSAHLSVAKGTAAENKAYVTKEESRAEAGDELGEPAAPGARTDLAELYSIAANPDKTIRDLFESGPGIIRYSTGALKTYDFFHKPKRRTIKITLLIGPTGIGKSLYAHSHWPKLYPLFDPTGAYWQGYQDEEEVLLDEFDSAVPLGRLLQWTDRYPFRIPNKFGDRILQATHFIFASNFEPIEWYGSSDERQRAALRRRLDEFGTRVSQADIIAHRDALLAMVDDQEEGREPRAAEGEPNDAADDVDPEND